MFIEREKKINEIISYFVLSKQQITLYLFVTIYEINNDAFELQLSTQLNNMLKCFELKFTFINKITFNN